MCHPRDSLYGWTQTGYLPEEGQGLLAEALRIADVGEDDLLACLDALGCSQVDLSSHRILGVFHALGHLLVREYLVPEREACSGFLQLGSSRYNLIFCSSGLLLT